MESLAGRLPPALQAQIQRIEPSRCGDVYYFPCRVLLNDGTTVDRVYVVEQSSYLQLWGVYPWDDPSKEWLDIRSVKSLDESSYRIPAPFANQIYAAGETGMGYSVFTVVFRDGTKQAHLTGNAVDFIEYPKGQSQIDVVAVLPNVGREDNPMQGPSYRWCLYSDDETERLSRLGLTAPIQSRRLPAIERVKTQLERFFKGR